MEQKPWFGRRFFNTPSSERKWQAIHFLRASVSLPRRNSDFSLRSALLFVPLSVFFYAAIFLVVCWHGDASGHAIAVFLACGVVAGLVHAVTSEYFPMGKLWLDMSGVVNGIIWLIVANTVAGLIGAGTVL